MAEVVVIYTDGACSGNPGPGGWAWAVAPHGDPSASGAEPHTTNQRMEIYAALHALRTFENDPRGIRIVSDSNYVVKCFNDRWWEGWLKRGWKNSQRQPVANRDLWEPLIALVRRRAVGSDGAGSGAGIEFEWVKAHNGDPMNELVDQMAVAQTAIR